MTTYGATDWSVVDSRMMANPTDPTNPNVMVIPLSLGNGYLSRYEWAHDIADFERALSWFRANYSLWGQRRLTPAVARFLDVSALRLRIQGDASAYRDRIEAVWQAALAVTPPAPRRSPR